MKRRQFIWTFAAVLVCLLVTGPAHATLMLTEVFLGGRTDANYFSMVESGLTAQYPGAGNRAVFRFDLTEPGGNGQLRASGEVIQTVTPTRDETDYDPALYQTPFSAYVDFWMSEFGSVSDGVDEFARINIESNTRVINESFSLEDDANGIVRFRVDLDSEGLLDLLADGQLLAIAIAPRFGQIDNTFTLDRVRLTAQAAPVPEPGTILLLCTGLLGFGIFQRRRKRTP